MAYIDYVISPTSGQLVERTFVNVTGGEIPEDWEPGEPNSDIMQLPDNYKGPLPTFDAPADYGADVSGLSEPLSFYLPPEVQAVLAPGVDPFASIVDGQPVSYPNLPTGGTGGGANTMNPSAPTQAGTGGLLPGIAPLPIEQVVSPISSVNLNAIISDDDAFFHGGLGKVFIEVERNRQITGVRMGTLPMVVIPEWARKGGR